MKIYKIMQRKVIVEANGKRAKESQREPERARERERRHQA